MKWYRESGVERLGDETLCHMTILSDKDPDTNGTIRAVEKRDKRI